MAGKAKADTETFLKHLPHLEAVSRSNSEIRPFIEEMKETLEEAEFTQKVDATVTEKWDW